MKNYRFLKHLIPITILFLFASCKTTNLSSIGSGEKPFRMEEDEKRVWQDAERLERILDRKGFLYQDQNLEPFLEEIAKRLLAENVENPPFTPRIKVIKSPYLNAFALPQGVIYIHTGMLARMENEAQLATVLGHELTHITHRHSIKEIRKAKNQEAFFRFLQALLVVPVGAYGGGSLVTDLTDQVGAIWTLASVTGYSREMETEADTEGLRMMVRAGYDPGESVKVFELLQRDLEENKIKEPFFYGTHPHIRARIENYRRLLTTLYETQAGEEERLKNAKEFQARIEPVILENTDLDLQWGSLKIARTGIEKLLLGRPDCARAHFFLGEIYRRSGKDEINTQKAIAAYREATRLSPPDPLPYRELGFLYRSQNRQEEACAAFEQYLALNPKAVDANIIRRYLTELINP